MHYYIYAYFSQEHTVSTWNLELFNGICAHLSIIHCQNIASAYKSISYVMLNCMLILITFTPEIISLLLHIDWVTNFNVNLIMVPRDEAVQPPVGGLQELQLGEGHAT